MRLDKKLVEQGYFESRNKALQAILEGLVFVDDEKVKKPSQQIELSSKIEIKGTPLKYVSRGGLKLEKAIDCFKIKLENKILLDIGSSTGGFVDCALMSGIKKVYGVDVGKNQMSPKLVNDSRLELYEKTDIRKIDVSKIEDANIITIDVSFISVSKIIFIIEELKNVNEVICLIKPQFECGKEVADKFKGIILDKKVHYQVIEKVINDFSKYGFGCQGVVYSPIKGGSGNIEYLAYFKRKEQFNDIKLKEVIDSAFSKLS